MFFKEGDVAIASDWTGDNRLSFYFALALLGFIVSFLILPSAKMVNNFYYVFLAMPALAAILFRRGREFEVSAGLVLWAALLIWLSLMGLRSGDGQYFKHVLYVAFFVVLVSRLVDPTLFRQGVFARGLFWLLLAYVLLSALFYWMTGRYAVGARVLWLPSRMTGPIYTSMWLACCFALTLPTWLQQRRWVEMLAALLLAVFCIAYVLQSRSGLVGLAALSGVAAAWTVGRNFRRLPWVVAFTLVAAVALVMAREVPQLATLLVRADSGRFELWQTLLGEWVQCGLWLGCGVLYESQATILGGAPIQHPHNIFLALGVYGGLVSLVIFAALCVGMLYRAWRLKDPWGLYLLVGIVGLNFDGSMLIGNPDELWLLILLPLALIDNPSRTKLPLSSASVSALY